MAYIGQSLTEGTRRAYTFVATAGQTTFNAVYGVGAVDVYQNGILLQPSDYNSSSGSSVVLGVGAAVNDEITIIAHNTFSVADTVSSSQGGTFTGNVSMSGTLGVTGAVTASNGLTVDDDGATPLTVDRATSDGTVIDVQKNGSTVGGIGTYSGYYTFGQGDTGLLMNAASDVMHPWNFTGNSGKDNLMDLGASSQRFKDIYLGGGAYLGGTGASNKLDDYEEGTFTATLVGYYGSPSTAVTSTGQYTKVGNQVSFWINMENKDTTGASGNMWISGLPFASSGNYEMCMAEMARAATFTNSSPFGLVSGTIVYFYSHASAALSNVIHHNAGTGRTIRVSGTYRTS